MNKLAHTVRESSGRIIAALAARYRDLDIAEEAYAESCVRAAAHWPARGDPTEPAAWLYRVADRYALDLLRRRRTRARLSADPPEPEPNAEDLMVDDSRVIPDERLQLIFICCHPAIAPESRVALTLKLVCGFSAADIAAAFLISEAALRQRLLRAKQKIAVAGIAYEVPGREAWAERLDAVLSTLEVAYAKSHEDAAGAGRHAGFTDEVLRLSAMLVELIPDDAQVLALAALVRYAEARRPARTDAAGMLVPLSDQDPALWRQDLIAEADTLLRRAGQGTPHARVLEAAIHAIWCGRRSLAKPAPWQTVLQLYDLLLLYRDDPIVRLNRTVALAEVDGPVAAFEALRALDLERLESYLSYWVLRADLERRLGQSEAAGVSYDTALKLGPGLAERKLLERRRAEVSADLQSPARDFHEDRV